MEQAFEFIANHPILVGLFVALLAILLFTENRKGGQGISTQEATQLINKEDGVVIDLRSESEYKAGHILNAVNIPYTSIQSRLSDFEKYKDKPIILVCKIGQHSRPAGKILMQNNIERVLRLTGGIGEWTASNLPLIKS